MITGAFGIKSETKKSDIDKYFTSIETTMNTVKAKLNDVVAKNGKFAANAEKDANAVNGVAANAIGKTLSTLIIAIRNTVDSGLKTISDALATVTQEDKSVDSTTPTDAATGGQ
ncbi:hypothetical protein BT0_E18 (plasmid) [Borrelia turicatae 91E135]|uniref:Variable large protein n=1 Tax=Borrelia turicatae (strain 91E135) TaxID=314724 RepID=A0ABF7QZT0_BORT9|nr:hypothetical protein BT0_E18 [Borrelia turicatae 91E135]